MNKCSCNVTSYKKVMNYLFEMKILASRQFRLSGGLEASRWNASFILFTFKQVSPLCTPSCVGCTLFKDRLLILTKYKLDETTCLYDKTGCGIFFLISSKFINVCCIFHLICNLFHKYMVLDTISCTILGG